MEEKKEKKNCPVCKNNLSEIMSENVYCYECGEGYHKECYKKVGKCVICTNFTSGVDLEKISFDTVVPKDPTSDSLFFNPTPPEKQNLDDIQSKNKTVWNNSSFQKLMLSASEMKNHYNKNKPFDPENIVPPDVGETTQQLRKKILTVIPPEQIRSMPFAEILAKYDDAMSADLFYELSANEICLYTGNCNFPKLLSFFRIANTSSKLSFNVFALFFTPIYHFFLRMRFVGILFSAAVFIGVLPQIIPIIIENFANPAATEEIKMLTSFLKNNGVYFQIFSLIISFFSALFSDQIYLKFINNKVRDCLRRIKQERKSAFFNAMGNLEGEDYCGKFWYPSKEEYGRFHTALLASPKPSIFMAIIDSLMTFSVLTLICIGALYVIFPSIL